MRLPDTPQLWEQNRPLIRQLYQGQDGKKETLARVRNILIEQHNFPESPLSIYEARFRDIGLRKKMKKEDWLPIWLHCRKLKEEGGNPEVVLCGSRIPWTKAWKEIRRVKAHLAPRASVLPRLPPGVVVHDMNSPIPPSPSLLMASNSQTYTHQLPAISPTPIRPVQLMTNASDIDNQSSLMEYPMEYPMDIDVLDAMAIHGPALSPLSSCLDLMVQPSRIIEESVQQKSFMNSCITLLGPSGSVHNMQSMIAMQCQARAAMWKVLKPTALFNLPYSQFLRSLRYTSSGEVGISSEQTSVDGITLMLINLRIDSKSDDFECYPPSLFRAHNEDLQSPQALTLEIDPFYLLAKAVLRLSSNLVSIYCFEDRTMLRLLFTRIPSSVLSLLARSKLLSVQSAWRSLIDVVSESPMMIEDVSKMFGAISKEVVDLSVESVVVLVIAGDATHLAKTLGRGSADSTVACSVVMEQGLTTAIRYGKWRCACILINWMVDPRRGNQEVGRVWRCIKDELRHRSVGESVIHSLKRCGLVEDGVIGVLREFAGLVPLHLSGFRSLLSDVGKATSVALASTGDWCQCCSCWQGRDQQPLRIPTSICKLMRERGRYLGGLQIHDEFLREDDYCPFVLLGALVAVSWDWRLHDRVEGHSDHFDVGLMDGALEWLVRYGPRAAVLGLLELLRDHEVEITSKHLAHVANSRVGTRAACLVALQTLHNTLGVPIAALGGQALAQAIIHKDTEMIQWLLGVVVDVNGVTPDGTTVMGSLVSFDWWWLCRHSLLAGVQMLVARGAKLLLQPGDTSPIPLLEVLIRRLYRREAVAEIVPFFEGVDLTSLEAANLVLACADSKHWELLQFLLDEGVPCHPEALAHVIFFGGPQHLIQRLIKQTADIITTTGPGALVAACNRLDLPLCNQLLALGVSADATDKQGNPALFAACEAATFTESDAQDQQVLVRSLLVAGAHVNKPNTDGKTPLHVVAWNGNLELAILLLDIGADYNITAYRRYDHSYPVTALDWAAFRGRLDIVQLLLDAGAQSAQQKRTCYDTALCYALYEHQWEVVQLIMQYAHISKQDLRDIVLEHKDSESILRRMIEHAPANMGFGFDELDWDQLIISR